MADPSNVEQPVPLSEIQKAERMLTPEQRIMSRVKAGIVAPLEQVDLPEDQKKIIFDYSELAAKAAVEEFERLKAERLADQLLEELKKGVSTSS